MRGHHPDLSATEIVEDALSERAAREGGRAAPTRTPEKIRVWLDQFSSVSEKIPARPGERFGRDVIYPDHG